MMNDDPQGNSRSRPGRKPLHNTAMTDADRKQRSRAQLRERGSREFCMRLEGVHLRLVEGLAAAGSISHAEVLKQIVSASLDRFVGVANRADDLRRAGASDEAVAAYIRDHLVALPPYGEKGV